MNSSDHKAPSPPAAVCVEEAARVEEAAAQQTDAGGLDTAETVIGLHLDQAANRVATNITARVLQPTLMDFLR